MTTGKLCRPPSAAGIHNCELTIANCQRLSKIKVWRRNIRPPARCPPPRLAAACEGAGGRVGEASFELRSSNFEVPQLNTLQTAVPPRPRAQVSARGHKRINGQAARLISIGKLHTSRCVHTRPIDLVIFQEPLGILRSGTSHLVEGFTLRCFQRLSLPHLATRRYD